MIYNAVVTNATMLQVMYSDEKYVPMIVILEDFSLLPIPSE